MIDEDRTMQLFGYTSEELSCGSGKLIVFVCNDCGRYRVGKRRDYRDLCVRCTQRGERSYWFGKHISDKIKQKMSEERMGVCPTDATKAKMSKSRTGKKNHMFGKRGESSPLFGRHHSDETKLKMSIAVKGRCFSDEHCHNISLGKQGKSYGAFTDEHKRKISAAHQGVSYDEWEGFAVEQRYCDKFDEECRESNREKYDRQCFLCGKHESEETRKLSVHHVDMNKDQGCDGKAWKLVPLCRSCHGNVHNKLWKSRIEYLLRQH